MLFTPKVAFWKAWMKNKVFGNQIKEEKLEIFASVPYRSNTGKGKERIWERYRQKEEKLENLSDFQQIQVKFYQLFATVIRWSLENLKKNLPKLSFVWRERGRKEEICVFWKKKACGQLNKQTNVKIEKTTPRLKRPSKKKLKSWVSLKSEHFCSFLKKIGLRPA